MVKIELDDSEIYLLIRAASIGRLAREFSIDECNELKCIVEKLDKQRKEITECTKQNQKLH